MAKKIRNTKKNDEQRQEIKLSCKSVSAVSGWENVGRKRRKPSIHHSIGGFLRLAGFEREEDIKMHENTDLICWKLIVVGIWDEVMQTRCYDFLGDSVFVSVDFQTR